MEGQARTRRAIGGRVSFVGLGERVWSREVSVVCLCARQMAGRSAEPVSPAPSAGAEQAGGGDQPGGAPPDRRRSAVRPMNFHHDLIRLQAGILDVAFQLPAKLGCRLLYL